MGTRWLTAGTFRGRRGAAVRATYEHPWPIRLTHWLIAIALFVMAASGIQILRAFPAFGPKVPEHDIVDIPSALALGGWLAGGLQWHFTFMWIFAGAGVLYLATQIATGRYRMVLFRPRDVPGVWPMVRHYFLFGPRPALTEPYNPLQKLAYTVTLGLGTVSVLTGLVLYKPAQFSPLASVFGGYHLARIWHFSAMCGLLAFVPGHLVMVALHGWNNFAAMLTGWKREPEFVTADGGEVDGSEVASRQEPADSGVSAEPAAPLSTEPAAPLNAEPTTARATGVEDDAVADADEDAKGGQDA